MKQRQRQNLSTKSHMLDLRHCGEKRKNHIQKHSWKEKGNTEDWRHSLCFGDALQENLLPKGIHSHSPWKSGLFLSLGQLFVYSLGHQLPPTKHRKDAHLTCFVSPYMGWPSPCLPGPDAVRCMQARTPSCPLTCFYITLHIPHYRFTQHEWGWGDT